jgi:hypothetical protein
MDGLNPGALKFGVASTLELAPPLDGPDMRL